jgi:tyrosinase
MASTPNPQVPRISELVGATSAPFQLTGLRTQVTIPMQEPTGPASREMEELANWEPRRVILNFEKITGGEGIPTFDVYLNVPPGETPQKHPELYAGPLPMFGLYEASISDEFHTPSGLYKNLEVTSLFARLSLQKDWDPKNLRVTLVPRSPGLLPPVSVGRASLVFA